jgi:hypothetical protein
VAFGVLLAMHIVIIHHENTRKHQCPVVGFETAAFANFDTLELNHHSYKAANIEV